MKLSISNKIRRKKFRLARSKLFLSIPLNRKLSIRNKLIIYTSCHKTILMYVNIVWSNASKSQVKILIKAQNLTIGKLLTCLNAFKIFIFLKKLVFYI